MLQNILLVPTDRVQQRESSSLLLNVAAHPVRDPMAPRVDLQNSSDSQFDLGTPFRQNVFTGPITTAANGAVVA